MMIDGDIMGRGRLWAEGIMSLDAYLAWQFWAAAFVFAACLPQLFWGRKFRWPPEPGSLTVIGYYLGVRARSSWLAILLRDLGALLDFAATIIGRLGIVLQGVVAMFAIDDVLAEPSAPRPLITWMLIAVVMVQVKALTAYAPRLPRSLT